MQEILQRVRGTQVVLGHRIQRLGRDAFLIQGQVYSLADAVSRLGGGGRRRYGNAEPRVPATLSREGLAFLSKAAKGIKGGFTIEALSEVLPMFGWSMQEYPIAVEVQGDSFWSAAHQKDPAIPAGDSTYSPNSVPLPNYEAAKRAYEATKRIVTPTDAVPKSPKIGTLYVAGLQEPTPRSFGQSYNLRCLSYGKGWYGAPGWTITTPKGSVTFTNKLSRARSQSFMDHPITKVWSLLYKSGLKEQAANVLASIGPETVERTLKPTTYRSVENTGSCPACFSNVKLASGKIMRHGWSVAGRRQRGATGMSWHAGRCFGAGRLPFERSWEGTDQFLETIVLPDRKKHLALLAELKNRPDQVTVSSFRGDRVVSRGQPSYEMELKNAIREVEGQLEKIDKEIETLRWLVTHWRKRELPGPSERPIDWSMVAARGLHP